MNAFRRLLLLPTLIVALVLAGLPYPFSTPQLAAQSTGALPAGLTVLNLAPPGGAAAPQASALELQTIRDRLLQIRNRMAAQEPQVSQGPSAVPLVAGPQALVGGTKPVTLSLVGAESAIDIDGIGPAPANENLDPIASDTPGGGCGAFVTDVAELVAVNNGAAAFAAGNCAHVEASGNSGFNWSPRPVTPGPLATPIICCDHDVMYDDSTRVVFHSSLYTNGDLSKTAVGLDVYQHMFSDTAPSCTYFLGPVTGTIDFPHLGLTKNFLYISVNFVSGGSQTAFMLRYPKTALANCAGSSTLSTTGNFTSWAGSNEGQKVWRPSRGTNIKHTMIWAHRINNTTLRIFKWDDTLPAANNFTRNIPFSSSAAPGTNCAGGSNNTGYITAINTSLIGFNFEGAVTDDKVYFYWQAGPAASPMVQAHIDGVVIPLTGGASVPTVEFPVAYPHIFNSAYCMGFPEVTANKLGDLGMVLAYGGANAGGGGPVRLAVGVSDEFTGLGLFDLVKEPVSLQFADRNPAVNDRYGDYSSNHPSEPCEKWFVGTGYFLYTHGEVEQLFFEYGRHKHYRCWSDYSNILGNNE